MIRRLGIFVLALMPSTVKKWWLRLRGHEIGRDVHIGFSYLDVRKLVLKDGARIGSLNYFKGLNQLVMMEGSRIGGWGNWFTCSPYDYRGNAGHGNVFIGRGSALTNRHYFDIQDALTIGEQSFIAGFGSVFYTHGVSPDLGNFNRPITIGPHCYLGSHCLFLPGAQTGAYTFVGAGSVVTKDHSHRSHVLLAGSPAEPRKNYAVDAPYFTEDHTSFLPPKLPDVRAAARTATALTSGGGGTFWRRT